MPKIFFFTYCYVNFAKKIFNIKFIKLLNATLKFTETLIYFVYHSATCTRYNKYPVESKIS